MLCRVLTISGFDNCENVGIQADLKTFSALGCYGISVVSDLSIKTANGSHKHYQVPFSAVEEQLEFVFSGVEPAAIKVGMLYSCEMIDRIAAFLRNYAGRIPIILDPVISTQNMGHLTAKEDVVSAILNKLFPITTLVTLNPEEAFTISGIAINNRQAMQDAGEKILNLGARAVLIKGSHLNVEECPDVLLYDKCSEWFSAPSIKSYTTYGTGCTLSAAITACMALKQDLKTACELSKWYVSNAIEASQNKTVVDEGYAGTIHHFYHLWPTLYLIRKRY